MLRTRSLVRALAVPAIALFALAAAEAPVKYKVDTGHSSVAFKIAHNGVANVWGTFAGVSGTVTLEGDSGSMEVSVKADTVNTNNEKRDEHLRNNDFFAVSQYPRITFKSTKFVKSSTGYDVTGDLTLRGVTKEVTFPLTVSEEKEGFQKNTVRGFETSLVIKRSDFGMKTYIGPVGDEVTLFISLESQKQ